LSHLNSKSFAECLHTHFSTAAQADQTLSLELVQVNEANYSPRLESFSLIFNGPLTPVLSQRIYNLSHESLGSLDIFLVPVGPEGESMQYEAVFNRMRGDSE
jgi:hypothetical protein